jgi:hypothetical protein
MKSAKMLFASLGALAIVGCGPVDVGGNIGNVDAIRYSEQISITNSVGSLSVSVMLVDPVKGVGSGHFEVWVHGLSVGRRNQKYILLVSPDVSVSRNEQLVWSNDERYALLVCGYVDGTVESMFPGTNRYAYALFDTKFKRVWCNATQLDLEHFSFSDLERLGFGSLIK